MKWYGMITIVVIVVVTLGGVVYMGMNNVNFVNEKHFKTADRVNCYSKFQ